MVKRDSLRENNGGSKEESRLIFLNIERARWLFHETERDSVEK